MIDEKKVTDVAQPTPDLDVIMKDGLKQFEIPPEEPKTLVEPGSESGTGPAAAVTTKKKEDESPAPGGVPAAADETPAPGSAAAAASKNRFKSHEEAETGYKNLQTEFTRTAQQNKEMSDKLKALRTEQFFFGEGGFKTFWQLISLQLSAISQQLSGLLNPSQSPFTKGRGFCLDSRLRGNDSLF